MPKYTYLNFGEYWDALNMRERPLLARLSGLSYSFLHGCAHGKQKAGARAIAKLSKVDPSITPRLMRPDLYGRRAYVTKKSTAQSALPVPTRGRMRLLNIERGQGAWNKGLKTGKPAWNRGLDMKTRKRKKGRIRVKL